MNAAVDTTLVGLQTRPQLKAPNLAGAAGAGQAKQMQRFRKVAEDFEAVFIAEMIRPMFQNIEAEAPFSGGPAEDIWRNMQVDEYGKAFAKSGGIGIADQVMQQLIRMQEGR
ncbi:MAG: rod-binding protein [Rhodospirillaceae bacterium]